MKQPGRPLRILYVVNVSWFFVSHRLPLAVAAKAQGYDVHVAAHPDGKLPDIDAAGLVFHPLEINRSKIGILNAARLALSLASLYKKLKPDIIHHVTSKPVIFGSVAARIAKTPAVVNAIPGMGIVFADGSLKSRVLRIAVKLAYRICLPRKSTRLIFQNEENRQYFIRNKLAIESNTVLVRGAGVNLEQFSRRKDFEKHNPVVLLAARMLRSKGIEEFVAAANSIKSSHKNARFVLAGMIDISSPDRVSKQELAQWAANGAVEWIGHVEDMPALLSGVDIFCLPTYYGEGVPKALIEAAACSIPIVTTDIPGCRDIVRHKVNGLLIPPADTIALEKSIRSLLLDETLRVTYGQEGRRLVEKEFSVDQVVQETLAVYASLLS